MELEAKEHPLPARIMHWVHLVAMVGLAFSGFYIHRPFFSGAMGLMRYIHFICMYVVLLNLVVRIYWSFFGKEHDWREFCLTGNDLKRAFQVVRYYLFLRRDCPETEGKYNPLQKLTYDFWVVLLVVQGITGFSLYQPTLSDKVVGPVFNWLNVLVGGVAYMRVIHYLIMWIFIVTTAVHVYLSLAQDFSQFLYMLFGLKRKEA